MSLVPRIHLHAALSGSVMRAPKVARPRVETRLDGRDQSTDSKSSLRPRASRQSTELDHLVGVEMHVVLNSGP